MIANGSAEEAPEITPQVLHLRDLLKWVRQGRVRVPNFQRDFTWDRQRMLYLFDSIRKQYPIGTLLLWESSGARPMSANLGPLRLPENSGGKLLILDGQQRLTTLAGVLLFEEMARNDEDDRDPGRWVMSYDADTDSFSYYDPQGMPTSAVKVADLMGTKGLYAAAQRIMSQEASPNKEIWVARLESVSAALGAYRLPLVIFSTESLRLAVESFTRLNRSGQSMGADEMFSALTYDAEGDNEVFRLSHHIDSILADVARAGFGDLDRVVVLRSILLALGLDPFRTEWDDLAKSTRDESAKKMPAAIQEAAEGMRGAIHFLRKEGVWNRRLLPYSMQLVGLAAFFGKRSQPTEHQKALLRRWLWVTAFTEGFGGLNPSRILLQLKDLHDRIPQDENPTTVEGIDLNAPAHPFPERHDHRSARVRALLCVLLQRDPCTAAGKKILAEEMGKTILERGPDALVKVCARVERGDKPPLVSSPANRVFDVEQTRGQAKGWLSVGLSREVLESHYISPTAYDALIRDDHRLFVEERIKTLMAAEREFMRGKNVTPPKQDQPAASAIDVEDQVPLSDDFELSSSEP